jgi:hypothetical protein
MWYRIDLVWTDASEERIASIFRIEKSAAVSIHLLTLVPSSRIFLFWRWRRYLPPELRFTEDLHGATSQKTAFFIVTAVKISKLTKKLYFYRQLNRNLRLVLKTPRFFLNKCAIFSLLRLHWFFKFPPLSPWNKTPATPLNIEYVNKNNIYRSDSFRLLAAQSGLLRRSFEGNTFIILV